MPTPDSQALDLLLAAGLLASVALGGGLPLAIALRRQRRFDRALQGGHVAALARYRSRSGEPTAALRAGLERASDEELRRLGDAALASGEAFAPDLFDLVFETVEARQARRREAERRRESWRTRWQTQGTSDAPAD